MGEYIYAAVPDLKIRFYLGSRSYLGNVENFEEYRNEFLDAFSQIYKLGEEDIDFTDTDKQMNKLSMKDLKQLLDFQEIIKKLAFSHPEAMLKIISFIKLGMEVDIYSEYDEEKNKKYSSYKYIRDLDEFKEIGLD
ncbi:MAG: hypothetical protein QW478_05190 [Candidatus Micrarchaeaceae archaeon]